MSSNNEIVSSGPGIKREDGDVPKIKRESDVPKTIKKEEEEEFNDEGIMSMARDLDRDMASLAAATEQHIADCGSHLQSYYNLPRLTTGGSAVTPRTAHNHPAFPAVVEWLRGGGTVGRTVVQAALAVIAQENGMRLEKMEKAIKEFQGQ